MLHGQFLLLLALLLTPVGAFAQKPISVALRVGMSDQASSGVEDQITSFFRRELRALGDVTIASDTTLPDFEVEILGINARSSGGTVLGPVFTVGVMNRGAKDWAPKSRALADHLRVKRDSIGLNKFIDLGISLVPVRHEVFRSIYTAGTGNDLLARIRGIVAEIDNDVFEPYRGR
jgi:hypothetical protein